MCLITYTPDKKKLNLELLELAMSNNPHGFGVVYAKNDTLNYCKRMDGFDYFLKVLELVPEETPLAIHFRWATEGDKVLNNVHPFPITSKKAGHVADLCVMHNGTIRNSVTNGKYNDPESDTLKYVVKVLRPILQENPELIFKPEFLRLVERDIGAANKLLFLDGKGRVAIAHKEQGEIFKETPDIWYSNKYSFHNNWRSPKKTQNYTPSPTTSVPVVVTPVTAGGPTTDTGGSRNVYNTPTVPIELPDGAEVEKNLPKFLADMLGPNETLLKRNGDQFKDGVRGFGWVHDGMCIVHSFAVAQAHKRWYTEREKENTTKEVIKHVPDKVTDLLAHAQKRANEEIREFERKHDTSDFRIMGESEILHWVLEYPDEAARWMSKNGFFATFNQIRKALEEDVTFMELACEFIHKKSRNALFALPVDTLSKFKFG